MIVNEKSSWVVWQTFDVDGSIVPGKRFLEYDPQDGTATLWKRGHGLCGRVYRIKECHLVGDYVIFVHEKPEGVDDYRPRREVFSLKRHPKCKPPAI